MEDSIHEIVREAIQNYTQGTTKLGKYVEKSMYETVERIDAYLNSKFMDGDKDSLGRDKPFFNIVTAATNIWYRATDLDRKHIKILPDKGSSVALAFLATVHLQRWMDSNKFGVFLNQWGRALAKYGSAVVKFVEKDGDLIPSVISWNRFIPDPVDFDALPRIEKFYKTSAQLRKIKDYNQEIVKSLIDAVQTRRTLEGQNKDNFSNFIELYEVHGELSLSLYKKTKGLEINDGDETKYIQQMHVVSYVGTGKTENGKAVYDDFTLFCGRETKDPYMITHLIEEDGQTLSIGSVEYLFDPQWMQNHTVKQWKDQLDLASRLIFQTADGNFVGRNVLSAIETGDIMVHEINKPLTLINNAGHDIASVQGFLNIWKILGQEISNTPDLIRGITQAQPVTYGLGQIINQNSNSLFEIMVENKVLALENMLRTYVIPHLKKKLDTKEEIVATLDDAGIAQIDSMYVPKEAVKKYNRRVVRQVLGMETGIPSPFMRGIEETAVKEEMAPLGNMRPFKPSELDDKTWKEVFSDFKWDNLRVEITAENRDKASVLQSLTTLFQVLAKTDPAKANMVLNKIMMETSVI